MPRRPRLDWLALIIAVIVFGAIRLGPSLVGSRVFLGLDALRLFEPWSFTNNRPVTSDHYITDHLDSLIPALSEVHKRFLDGDWPSWSNHITGGAPLLSIPSFGVLTPGRWLYLFLPTWLAPAWSTLVQVVFAGWFTFLFARRLGASRFAGGIAAVVYPLTGFMIGWTNYPQVAVASIIPMMFWAVERYLQHPNSRSLVPVALASALLLFGGFPAVAGQAFCLVCGYAIVRLVTTHRRHARALFSQAGCLLIGVVTGVAITGFQLLPFGSQVLGGTDLGYRSSEFFDTTPRIAALSALFPKTFGSNQLCCGASPQDTNTYIGAVVLFLALLGIWQVIAGRVHGVIGVYLTLTIVAVLVLIWFPGWWTAWLDHLPVFHGNPIGRVRSQLGLPVAILAAAGVDAIGGHAWSSSWRRSRLPEGRSVTVGVAITTLALVCALAWQLHSGGYPFVTHELRSDALIAALPLAVIAVLALARRAPTTLLAIVAVSVVVQGFVATSFFWPTAARAEYYPTDAAIRYLQRNVGDNRIATTGLTLRPNVTELYGLRDLNGHSFLDPALKQAVLAIDPTALLGSTYTGFTSMVSRLLANPGLERLGVRYVVAGVDDFVPGMPNTPVPIPGTSQEMAPQSSTQRLVPNREYSVSIPPGALRGVNIPLTAPSGTHVAVAVRDEQGHLVAENSRLVAAGASVTPVPLADDPVSGGAPSDSPALTLSVSVDRAGAVATTDSAGAVRVQPVHPPASGAAFRLAYAGDGLVIWEQLQILPRIHWANSATVIADAPARARAVATSPVETGDVILSKAPSGPLPARNAPLARLRVTQDSGDEMSVSVDAPTAGYVVVSDSIQSQFSATVDGRSTPIVTADQAGGAVYVPQGRHEIRIAYSPTGRSAGIALSAAGGAVIIGLTLGPSWYARFRRRRGSRRQEPDSCDPS